MPALRHEILQGDFRSMGFQHGESLRATIRELADERLAIICTDNPGKTPADVMQGAKEVEQEMRRQVPQVYEETLSTARAANIEYWRLLVAGGYSDIEDRVANGARASGPIRDDCTLVPHRLGSGDILLAGTWDSHATAERALVLIERRPAAGPWTLALSTAGWPMQQGVTSNGLAFAIANLVARETRPGVSYIAALPAIAAARDLRYAGERAESLVCCSARFYALCDSRGAYLGIETDGRLYWRSSQPDVHTNHFILPGGCDVEGRDASASERRLRRAQEEVRTAAPADALSLFRVLEVNDGTEASISRQATGRETRSCAGFVLDPARGSILATAGPPGLSIPESYALEALEASL